jgi:hypothetical protein
LLNDLSWDSADCIRSSFFHFSASARYSGYFSVIFHPSRPEPESLQTGMNDSYRHFIFFTQLFGKEIATPEKSRIV